MKGYVGRSRDSGFRIRGKNRAGSRLAFTLIELSIVLIIIGLIIGGILVGQSLIHSARLRSVSSEYQSFVAAINTFRIKYNGLPGDIKNATDFWGAAHSNSTTCLTTVGTGTQTCNGNGNRLIDDPTGSSRRDESFTFWQQLSNARLINGAYSGMSGNGSATDTNLAINVPESKIPNAGWHAVIISTTTGTGITYAMNYGNSFQFGTPVGAAHTYGPILSPLDAWNIDSKMDDGKPATGKVIARYWNNLCAAADDGTSANNDLTASYRVSDSTIRCSFIFRYAY